MSIRTLQSTLPLHTETPETVGIQSWESLAAQCNYRVSRLAQICQVSVRTLQRHFRKHYDITLSEWLREIRLEQSRVLLKEASCIKAVAFDLGYKQPSHFTRDFKTRYGVPPKMWQVAAGHSRTFLPTVAMQGLNQCAQSAELPGLFAHC